MIIIRTHATASVAIFCWLAGIDLGYSQGQAEPSIKSVNCEARYGTTLPGVGVVDYGTFAVNDWRLGLQQDSLREILDSAARIIAQRCSGRPRQYVQYGSGRVIAVALADERNSAIAGAWLDISSRRWNIEYNHAPQRKTAEDQAEAKANAERQRLADLAAEKARLSAERKRLQAEFVKTNGVQSWVNAQTLAANPFVYQGKVIGVRQNFQQMLSSSEALLSGGIVVTSVPSTLFTSPNEPFFLAIRVQGIKAVKTPIGGEMQVPYGSYVGLHRCRDQRCSDFID